MLTKKSLKRYFIIALITSLLASGLMGILVLLIGSFGEIEFRVLLSTFTIGVFSVTSLAGLRNFESEYEEYRRFAILSIIFSIAAMILTLSLIWVNADYFPWKPALVSIVLAVSTSHVSLLLPARNKTQLLNTVTTITFAAIAFVAAFIILIIVAEDADLNEFTYRILGVFAILDVIGTVMTPVLARLVPKNANAQEQEKPIDTDIPGPSNS